MSENKDNKSDNKSEKTTVPFSKIMLASGIGTLLVLIVLGIFKLLTFIGVIVTIGSVTESETVKPESFLKIDLSQDYAERTPSDMMSIMGRCNETGFNDLLRCIDAAASDKTDF